MCRRYGIILIFTLKLECNRRGEDVADFFTDDFDNRGQELLGQNLGTI